MFASAEASSFFSFALSPMASPAAWKLVIVRTHHLFFDESLGKFLPSANAGVAVLGNVLVGLLRSTVGGAGDLVRDVIACLLDGVHVGC